MAFECNAAKVGGLWGCCLVLFIIACILFGVSFDIVAPTQVGILFDQTSKTIDESVYPAGRYFVGVGKSFLKFPITYQVIDFSYDDVVGGPPLSVFSNEGQTIVIDISFFYRIDEQKIIDLYKIAAQNYIQLLIRKSEEVLKNVASKYKTIEFFTSREAIAKSMKSELNKQLYDFFFVRVPLLQLRTIDLPDELENSLVDKVVASQNQRTEVLRRNITVINSKIKVFQAQAEADVSVILQNATSTSFVLTQSAEAISQKKIIDAQSEVLLLMRDELFDGNNSHLFDYVYAQRIASADAESSIILGFDGGLIVKKT